jgi:sugar/nucleoside kinase (ribokinase family)
MRPIVVVGDVIDDVIVRPRGPVAPDSDTPAEIVRRPGGSGANVAAWLAHLGAPVRFAARVGAGDHDLPGVENRLAIDTERPTGTIVVLVDGGNRAMFTDRGANEALRGDDLPPELLDGAVLLHVSGYTLFAPGPRAAALTLIDAAVQRDIPVSVDCASASFLRDAPDFAEWIRPATICFANEEEAEVLTPAALRPADRRDQARSKRLDTV